MRRQRATVDAIDAKIWLERQRHADPKTGHTDSSVGSECFKAVKQFLIDEEPDADPWDQRTDAAFDSYDDRHKPIVPKDPQQPRLLQVHSEWRLDRQKRITIPEGRANRDDIDLRISVLEDTYESQRMVYQKERAFLLESRRRARNKKMTMEEIWKPDGMK